MALDGGIGVGIDPCQEQPEHYLPSVGTPGSESRGWKRDGGSRTEARRESAGIATGPLCRRASP